MGLYFGKEMGEKLRLLPVFNDVDVLIPIPLHHRKKFIRGYNQAEMICRGIEQSTQIPIETQVLKRLVHSSSQTKKGKLSRWESMQHKFYGDKRTTEQFNHILIVDDVATTGSTLEICFHTLRNQFPNSKISVAVLAIAE
jgi:ComF family protein